MRGGDAAPAPLPTDQLLVTLLSGLLRPGEPERALPAWFAALVPFGLEVGLCYVRERKHWRLAATGGIQPADAALLEPLDFGQSVAGTVAVTRMPLLIGELRWNNEPRHWLLRRVGLESWACEPLLSGGELRGVLAIGSRSRGVLGEPETGLLRAAARHLADALAVAEEQQAAAQQAIAAHEQASRAQQLARFAGQLGETAAADGVVRLLLQTVRAMLSADGAMLQLADPTSGMLELGAHDGLPPTAMEGWAALPPTAATVCGLALRGGEPVHVADVAHAPLISPEAARLYAALGMRAVRAVPLMVDSGRVIGIVTALWREPRPDPGADAALADEAARQAAATLVRGATEPDVAAGPLLAAAHDCIKVLERDGTLSFVNDAGVCEFDLPADQALGRDWLALWPAEAARTLKIAIADGLAGHASRVEAARAGRDGASRWWDISVGPIRDSSGQVARLLIISREITERRQAEAQAGLVAQELHHRVKNALSTVQAIAFATSQSARSLYEFRAQFSERLAALAQTHDLLVSGDDQAKLRELIAAELAPYLGPGGGDAVLNGPELVLDADVAVPLGMALHELATNAAKHGALAQAGGVVSVRWLERGDVLELEWSEAGGPPVSPPAHRGFGSELLDDILSAQLQATVRRDFLPGGIRVTLAIPLPGTGAPSRQTVGVR